MDKSRAGMCVLALGCVIASTNTGIAADVADVHEVVEQQSLADAILGGTIDLQFRYRFGYIDDDGFPDDARASTLRTMLGYRTRPFYGVSGYIQFRNVTVIGSDRYNDTLNGRVNFPVEADPRATEVDQAYGQFDFIPDTKITVGRRKLKFGNQRFISDLGWRQNNRSFDGFVIENKSLPDTTLIYSYAFNINRAFTDRSPNGNFDKGTNVHLFNAAYQGLPWARIEAYSYLLDLDGIVAPPPSTLSTATIGGVISGKVPLAGSGAAFIYTAEYAHQWDWASNTRNVSLDYARIEPGITYGGFTVKGGLEYFESDGVRAFSAPLGLLHAFGGWADRFTPAPASGLRDYYASAAYTFKNLGDFINSVTLIGAYHYFDTDSGGAHHGDEWDAGLFFKIKDNYALEFKYANYDANAFSTDTQKFWVSLVANFQHKLK